MVPSNVTLEQKADIEALFQLVDKFSREMKLKLMSKVTGYGNKSGWDSEADYELKDILCDLKYQIEKDELDPIDIANFAAFYWNKL